MLNSITSHPLFPWIAAVASGILLFLGYAGFDQFYLEWIFLVPLFWALRDARPGRAFLIGWVAGIVGHGGGFYWVIDMFKQFAGAPLPFALVGLALLAAANGIVVAAWAWGIRVIAARGWQVIWVAPVVWTAMEKFWPEVFPNYLGASQYRLSHLTQIADFAGILGVSFLVVYINATLYWVTACWFEDRRLPWRALSALALSLLFVLGYGEVRLKEVARQVATAQTLKVGLVQTNRGAADLHIDSDTVLQEHREMSRTLVEKQRPDLVVWPEGVPVSLSFREGVLPIAALGDLGTPLLFGACLRVAGGICNSAFLVDASGRILGSYDKTVLVPFGEYIPFGDTFPSLYSWSPYSSRFWRGQSEEPLRLGNRVLSLSICYEDIFPLHIRKLMAGGKERRVPEAMFNLTNDSWYGNSTEPVQHLALASFRSIENRRSLVRVTNTGISAFVDPAGRIVKSTGIWTKEVLVDKIPLLQGGGTPYSVAGDWIGWLCALLTASAITSAYVSMRRQREAEKG
ncbi:apolipoprotein N-acyltransferase [Citrifermentans bremense]|uniref:apolipoprotein N-acyltransferase n=1 Tax=Citrifermentans bremense TaxID=60035 RepID=UPI0004209BB6|nr:apolipoprotein N-acyltransferase [Citrifermentans bremense]